MPATEKTWRDQAKMHVLFGISALVMLGGTIWMLAKDHNREWRQWQLDDRARERWTFEAQLAQTEANSKSDLERLGKELEAARSAKVDGELVKKFEELVQTEDARLKKDNKSETPADFTKLENAKINLEATDNGSDAARDARKNVLNEMDKFVHEAKRRENAVLTKKKFVAADQTAAISARG